jgi:transposase-like protein
VPPTLEPRRTAEKALVAVVQEAYVHGVSTRAVDDLVKALGAGGMSKSQVSRLCAEIDERVSAFLGRPLEGRWPYLWLDATYLKVRDGGRIVSRAAIIAVAVNGDGKREVLGVATGPSEAEAFWTDFLRSLADRGLRGVRLVIADDHKGLRAAARRVFNATLQRCRVHWMRNALAYAPAKQRAAVVAMLKTIFAQETKAEAGSDHWSEPVEHRRRRPAREAAQAQRHDGRLPRGRPRVHGLPKGALAADRQHQPAGTPDQGCKALPCTSAAPTSSASFPTTRPSSASSARRCSRSTTSGPSPAAT